MDTNSFVSAFTPIESLIDRWKHFVKGLGLSEMHPLHGNFSEDNRKVVRKMNFEPSPGVEMYEVVVLRSKPLISKKPSK